MATTQLNSELFRAMGEIADDETLMNKVLKYVKKLAAQKKANSTLMTEEFYAKLARGEEEYRQGKCTRLQPGESVTEMLRRSGYNV